eukprot:CAMPEP_0172175322 /NCGR_PEP_ID=MMETSP1050-20130122/14159_1 /TAXON_ID=233186 /ORGANISM="Cryptomonas curvata, Strain CCAP979/52" /LENGTH=176 /DNA_ID=CAMNT_0012847403 /DNA_START=8 /DNA_END=535 /DNA_ORIENTATION=-
MPLADILSLDDLNLYLPLVQDRVLQLRLVSRDIMLALESKIFAEINIRINDAGVDCLTADFLQRWHGKMHLHCTRPWTPDSRWFKEVRDALLLDRLRPLSLLSLSVTGNNLHSLVETLIGLGTAIQQLEIAYHGNGAELLAAATPIAFLAPGRVEDQNQFISFRDNGLGPEGATAL